MLCLHEVGNQKRFKASLPRDHADYPAAVRRAP
jgi:hypothetical protein